MTTWGYTCAQECIHWYLYVTVYKYTYCETKKFMICFIVIFVLNCSGLQLNLQYCRGMLIVLLLEFNMVYYLGKIL